MEKSYRSPGLQSGYFSQIGVTHCHIDTNDENRQLVLRIVKKLEAMGYRSKFNNALAFAAGNQRKIYPETYGVHTPTKDGKEQLDNFSTTEIPNKIVMPEIVDFVNNEIKGTKGIIIELEQVIGSLKAGSNNKILIPNGHSFEPIKPGETIIPPKDSLAFEIHHRFDVPKAGGTIPPDILKEFLEYCEEMGIEVGGAFLFEKEHDWAFRTNAFTNGERLLVAEQERVLIQNFLDREKLYCNAETSIERILGIWNT